MQKLNVDTDKQLTVSFPAGDGYLRICRLNATAMASDLGFDVDALDDLRLAINEAVSWLLDCSGESGSVTIQLDETSGPDDQRGLMMVGERSLPGTANGGVDRDLMDAILGATVDSYELDDSTAGLRRVTLHKICGGPA